MGPVTSATASSLILLGVKFLPQLPNFMENIFGADVAVENNNVYNAIRSNLKLEAAVMIIFYNCYSKIGLFFQS